MAAGGATRATSKISPPAPPGTTSTLRRQTGRSRRRDILVPRQLAMYLCRRFTNASLAEIGRELGREHPAVRNAVKQVEKRVTERAPARYQLEAVSERVRAELEGRPVQEETDGMTPPQTERQRKARSVIPIRDAVARRA